MAVFLRPLGQLYHWLSRIKKASQPSFHPTVPTICVGNVTLGGAGKTPTVIALTHILRSFHLTPHIISRGYKGKTNYTHRVTADDNAEKVGDEAVLLSKAAPTWVGKTKVKSCKKAIKQGASILIMDDGLQSQAVHKHISFLVVDGQQAFGNGEVFPAGPLRTTIEEGLNTADAVIVIHESKETQRVLKHFKKPVFQASFKACLPIPPQKVIAFAGLGYPLKFKIYLKSLGFDVVRFFSFPDHHGYTKNDLKEIMQAHTTLSFPVLTTEKDGVKLGDELIPNLHTLPISLEFRDKNQLIEFLEEKIKAATLDLNPY